jgi:hypothetical protein
MAARRADLTAGQSALLAAAAAAVGLALQIHDGQYDPSGLALIALATAATLAAILGAAPRLTARGLALLLAVLVAAELTLVFTRPVAMEMTVGPGGRWPLFALLGAAAGVLAVLALDPRWLRRWRPAAILLFIGLYFAAGVWLLRHAPPATDVFNFQRGALEAFRHGRDPYSIRFRNIYHPYEGFYGPGLVVRGVLQFGYPYPPLTLFLAGAALPFGDIRYAHLAALALGGGALACAQPGRLAPLAAGLLLFSPRFGLLLQMSWTEPFLILFLSLTVLCARRAPRLVPLFLGLLLASKQYLLLLAPAAILLVPGAAGERRRQAARLLLVATAVALAVTLPLALWDPPAFVRSAVTLHLRQPFRLDALSFAAAIARAGGPRLTWLPLLLGPAALAVALWRAPRTPAGFAATAGFVFLVAFAGSKQAFCNFYFFPLAALCAAVAVAPDGDDAVVGSDGQVAAGVTNALR